jgi:mannose-6-phosphate isomerase-like protein (cupin superfamily)
MVRRVEKPWGFELIFAETARYAGKRLHIHAGCRLSLQFHRMKDETLFVEDGELGLEVIEGEDLRTFTLQRGECFHICPQVIHRLTGLTDVDIIEVSTPEIDDVVRIEDDYGRQGTSDP